jgi:antitoxin component of MazEF toxin-antitoxin module
MLQNVLKVGNSLGVTFPKSFVDRNKVQPGMKIDVNDTNDSITYSTKIPKSTKYEAISDKEFLEAVKQVESIYKEALDELAILK